MKKKIKTGKTTISECKIKYTTIINEFKKMMVANKKAGDKIQRSLFTQ